MRRIIAAILFSGPLSGCAAGDASSTIAPPQAACDNGRLDEFVGRKADAVLGAQMLAASGARTLRWSPPRSAMTMDFRPDRLTVAYDDAMLITSARCG